MITHSCGIWANRPPFLAPQSAATGRTRAGPRRSLACKAGTRHPPVCSCAGKSLSRFALTGRGWLAVDLSRHFECALGMLPLMKPVAKSPETPAARQKVGAVLRRASRFRKASCRGGPVTPMVGKLCDLSSTWIKRIVPPHTPSGAVRLRVTAGEGKRHHAAAARRQPRRHGCRWQGERRKTQALIETAHHTQAGGHGPMPSITRPADTATTSPSSRGRQVSLSLVSGILASITISWKPGATVTPLA